MNTDEHGLITLFVSPSAMKYRAVIKQSGNWLTGWLVDLPGVNAQEKTKTELMKSLKIGAQEMLATEIIFEPEAIMTTIKERNHAKRPNCRRNQKYSQNACGKIQF